MPRERRKFTPEYKAEVVKLIRSSDKSFTRIARELDLTPSAVGRWLEKAEAQSTPEGRAVSAEGDELRRLRKENAQLRMERDFLKKAAAFFAKESA